MRILEKIKNLLLFKIFYKILDPIYIFLDKRHIRRSKNMHMIPNAFLRRGGAYSYAEWSYIIGVLHTIIENNLSNKSNLQILDVGCGAGLVLNAVNEFVGKNGSYTGIDVMKSEIDFVKNIIQNLILFMSRPKIIIIAQIKMKTLRGNFLIILLILLQHYQFGPFKRN